jgi:hypothetical protein
VPMIPSPAGALPFVGIKLAGYTAFAAYLNRRYAGLDFPRAEAARRLPNPLTTGFGRTMIGLAGGVSYGLILAMMPLELPTLAVFLALAPLRACEWALVIWFLYDRGVSHRDVLVKSSLQGMGVSYLLDVPAFGIWMLLPGVPMC